MKRPFYLLLALSFLLVMNTSGQSKAMTFEEAEKQGIPFQHLDSLYKSAVHDNTALAVFKSSEEQAQVMQAYTKLLQDLGSFLKAHNFSWEQQTRGFNRIYFKPDGSIDYFLFNFPPGQVAPEKEKEFCRLLGLFIQDYRLTLAAPERFAQCSPVRYSDI
ncbi:hypothetical protein OB13_18340 [Pontibacter sp. HJ8]